MGVELGEPITRGVSGMLDQRDTGSSTPADFEGNKDGNRDRRFF